MHAAVSLAPSKRNGYIKGALRAIMDFWQNATIIFIGFIVWELIAPKIASPRYSELFLAYMTALLLCLIASSELLTVKPAAFFFTIGGVFAFFLELAKKTVKITIKK